MGSKLALIHILSVGPDVIKLNISKVGFPEFVEIWWRLPFLELLYDYLCTHFLTNVPVHSKTGQYKMQTADMTADHCFQGLKTVSGTIFVSF